MCAWFLPPWRFPPAHRGSSCTRLLAAMASAVLGDRNSILEPPGSALGPGFGLQPTRPHCSAAPAPSYCSAPLGRVSGFARYNRSQRNVVTLLDDNARLQAAPHREAPSRQRHMEQNIPLNTPPSCFHSKTPFFYTREANLI